MLLPWTCSSCVPCCRKTSLLSRLQTPARHRPDLTPKTNIYVRITCLHTIIYIKASSPLSLRNTSSHFSGTTTTAITTPPSLPRHHVAPRRHLALHALLRPCREREPIGDAEGKGEEGEKNIIAAAAARPVATSRAVFRARVVVAAVDSPPQQLTPSPIMDHMQTQNTQMPLYLMVGIACGLAAYTPVRHLVRRQRRSAATAASAAARAFFVRASRQQLAPSSAMPARAAPRAACFHTVVTAHHVRSVAHLRWGGPCTGGSCLAAPHALLCSAACASTRRRSHSKPRPILHNSSPLLPPPTTTHPHCVHRPPRLTSRSTATRATTATTSARTRACSRARRTTVRAAALRCAALPRCAALRCPAFRPALPCPRRLFLGPCLLCPVCPAAALCVERGGASCCSPQTLRRLTCALHPSPPHHHHRHDKT